MKKKVKMGVRQLIFAALLLLFSITGITAAAQIFITLSGYAQARNEYKALRQYVPYVRITPPPVYEQEEFLPAMEQDESASLQANSEPSLNFSDINPDYMGWIRIDGTKIDYPVVRGEDNEKYINTTFSGERNASGAIFMDYRCTNGFDSSFAILYGHNMKDGSMFAGLKRFLVKGAIDQQPEITVLTPDGVTQIYRIFAIIKTNITDETYMLPGVEPQAVNDYMTELGAPAGAERYIALSTCIGRDDADRLLVFAAK